jgi:menaquinone-9 beta-reductase
MIDVLIAGGGVAGSALAVLLGRCGFSVELFDLGHFPREKPCGEGLMPAGVAVLERLGLAEAVGGAPFHGVRYHFGKHTAEGRFPRASGIPVSGRGQRRKHLDRVLFEAAAATPGVKAHLGVRVEGPLCEHGRITGALVEGEPLRARLVVAADGVSSRIRRCLGLDAEASRKRFGIRAHFRLAKGQEQPPWVDVVLASGHELYITPLPDREVLVAVLTDIRHGGEPVHKTFQRWIFAQPLLVSRLDGAEQSSQLMCASWRAKNARLGVTPGAILLGDAMGSIDPISGGGMTHALVTAELLAAYIQQGPEESDEWMWKFERERGELLVDFKRLTRILLWLADHPWLAAQILSLVGNSPFVLSHFVGVAGGTRKLFVGERQPKQLSNSSSKDYFGRWRQNACPFLGNSEIGDAGK